MSLRSQRSEDADSYHHGGGVVVHGNNHNNNDDAQVYNYALRVVLLQHVIASKPPVAPAASASTPIIKRDNVMTQAAGNSNSRPSSQAYPSTTGSSSSTSTWSTLSSLSLSDVFRSSSSSSSSSSSPRYPERFLKVLEARIQLISTGHDKQYNDLLTRYTFANFYGKLKDPKHTRILKESRKLDELIMMFIATATESLRKNTPSTSDEWKYRLDEHLECFVDILGTALRNKDLRHVPPELIMKLETLKSRISANRPVPNTSSNGENGQSAVNADGHSSTRTSMTLDPANTGGSSNMTPVHSAGSSTNAPIASTSSSVSYNLADIPAARQLGMVFEISPEQVQRDINHLRKICTEKNAFADLKQCINLISMNSPFPACREDFLTEEAYREWRSTELASLQSEMLSILQRSPELVKTSSSDGRGDDGTSASTSATSNSGAKRTSGAVITEAGEAYIGRRISSSNITNGSTSRTSLPIAEQFASTLSFATASNNADESISEGSTYSSAIPFPSGSASSPNTYNAKLPPEDPFPSTSTSTSSSSSTTQLTFIPPTSPRNAYIRLLSIMLSYDLEAMADLDPSEEVPLRILSKLNQNILEQCFNQWRLSQSTRFVAFLSEMSLRYSRGEMPVVECVTEALGDFDALNERIPVDNWPIVDRDAFLYTVSTLLDALLKGFYETYSEQLPQQAAASIYSAILQLSDLPIFDEAVPPEELSSRLDMLKDAIEQVSEYFYGQERSAIFAHHAQHPSSIPSSASAAAAHEPPVEAFLDLLNWVKTSAKRYDKTYRSPLFGTVDIPQHFLERVVELYIRELSYKFEQIRALQQAKPLYTTPNDATNEEKPPITDGEVMALYRGVKEITEMHKAFCPNIQLSISLNEQFGPYILRWLAETDTKTLTWVRNAINLDSFKPEDNNLDNEQHEGEKYTSSIRDLVDSCKGALQFVTDLDWPDEYQNAVFITRLSATISKAIEQYCIAIEELYMREMAPRKRDSGAERDERTHAWITRAKALYNQDKKLVMYQFQPTSCLKLNNMHGARDLLDKMYTTVDADRVAVITRAKAPAVPARQAQRNLFTVKIVLGEGLATSDGVSRVDPFVTLSDERGMRIAKTRTLYETKEPRWSETFDISVEGKMWIAATIWNRNLVDEHELLGRTYIALDPAVFGDYLPHDLWQDLDTTGRLLLRVSMEGEKDDIQFFFGRAFRSLKRAENDMTRMIVDKISPFIRSSISTNSLKSLLKRGGYTSYLKDLNLDKAFEKARIENGIEGVKQLKNLIKTRDPNAPLIPLPAHMIDLDKEKALPTPSGSSNAGDKKKPTELSDAEIEEPLAPLLVYLDQSLETFRRHLSESAWQVVLTKIWKEVISVVESLLVPALSDQPTEMKPLSDKEVDIVFKWLKFLTDFFHADGQGVPMADLQNPRYRSVMLIRLYYDWSTDNLMEESVRLTNEQLKASAKVNGATRSKSVYQQRNLGTIRQRKKEKHEEADSGAAEMVMRILRMRPQAIDFLQQQMGMLQLVQDKQKKPTRLLGSIRGRGRGKGGPSNTRQRMAQHHPLPPIPSPQSGMRQQYM